MTSTAEQASVETGSHSRNALADIVLLGRLRWLQLLLLALLLTLVGALAFRFKFSVIDLDLWWHLKVGDWIVQHAAFPHTGILSRSAADRPWAAYSWGYEVLLSRSFAWFGLIGIGLYGTLLTLMVAFSVYWMTRRLSGEFWFAILLSIACCYAFLFDMMPRPVFFSIALLCVTLTLILRAESSGRVERLYWLPFIFLIWANLHIQFIYGLAVVGVLAATAVIESVAEKAGLAPASMDKNNLPVEKVIVVLAGCVLATLVSPYSYHLYGAIVAYSRSHLIYSMIKELQPLSFRSSTNYVQLLLAGAAFFAVAWQKKVNVYKVALLVLTSVVAFRTMRDSWFLCVAAAACIADIGTPQNERTRSESPLELAGVFAVTAVGLAILANGLGFNTRGIDRAVTTMFPVNAVNFLHRTSVRGPLYNTFDWGGFLTWYMPDCPVVIDGRTDLYGDELNQLMLDTQNGERSYKNDPYLNDAGVVLLRRTDGLATALESDARFQKIYEDQIASVFARRQ